jgi:putative phage-type endonuclease
MTALATPYVQGTEAWLEARLDGIGSSDAPVIAGERGSIIELWALKTRQLEPEPPDPDLARLFEWGHRLEPVIAAWYSDATERPLRRVNRMLVHPRFPWAFASLDRVSARKGERRIVEIKTNRWGWAGDEAVPGAVQAQVQHQMWVAGYDVADVVVLTGGSEPQIVEVPRDDEYIDNLTYVEANFWGHVTSKTTPKADGSENTRRALARMHPRDDGTWLVATRELVELGRQLRDARLAKKEAEGAEGTVANAILAIVREASGIEGVLSLKRTKDSVVTRINWPAVASGYRALLDDIAGVGCQHLTQAERERALPSLDAVEAVHTQSETAEGYRSIRLLKEST